MDHPTQATARWLCLCCGATSTSGDLVGTCAGCGDFGRRGELDSRVDVSLTVHELQVLVMWAERFAADGPDRMRRVLYGIADRLGMQLGAEAPALTLMGELSELRSRAAAEEAG